VVFDAAPIIVPTPPTFESLNAVVEIAVPVEVPVVAPVLTNV